MDAGFSPFSPGPSEFRLSSSQSSLLRRAHFLPLPWAEPFLSDESRSASPFLKETSVGSLALIVDKSERSLPSTCP